MGYSHLSARGRRFIFWWKVQVCGFCKGLKDFASIRTSNLSLMMPHAVFVLALNPKP